jgi:hypothetical protein
MRIFLATHLLTVLLGVSYLTLVLSDRPSLGLSSSYGAVVAVLSGMNLWGGVRARR